MIRLSADSWHGKLFMQIQEAWDAFRGKDDVDRSYTSYRHTDVCRYIRAWVIKLPLLLAVQLGFIAYALYVVAIYPLTYAGASTYLTYWLVIGCVFAVIVGAVLLVTGFGWVISKLKEHRIFREQEIEEGESKGPGLWEMFKQWIQDKHDKICTTVIINGEKK